MITEPKRRMLLDSSSFSRNGENEEMVRVRNSQHQRGKEPGIPVATQLKQPSEKDASHTQVQAQLYKLG